MWYFDTFTEIMNSIRLKSFWMLWIDWKSRIFFRDMDESETEFIYI